MDSRACAYVSNAYDLFEVNPIQLSTEESSYTEISPVSSLSDKTPIEFYVSGTGDNYIDLSHTLLQVHVKKKRKAEQQLAHQTKSHLSTTYSTPYFLNVQ
ncbi:uncharacterized protein F54H12.2 [Trichonephila clavata]|uniref:Uncharacterized protein F54H12.2 n=1 Tax=Trichonephila clavata TaxID=2740835 RepID=A0A8X6G1Q3_TRICU|nr:uncharacterized protein F54H12.2 [Trichonephila clavata]